MGVFFCRNSTELESLEPALFTGLHLANCGLTCLDCLADFINLEFLDISGNPLNFAGPLPRFGKLQSLNLRNTPLDSVSVVTRLAPDVRWLDMGNTRLSDLKGLDRLTGLCLLRIDGCKLQSVDELLDLRALIYLSVSEEVLPTEIETGLRKKFRFVQINRLENFSRLYNLGK